jgi:2-oxoisovalerate dehydrogenase E1 component beta subunit
MLATTFSRGRLSVFRIHARWNSTSVEPPPAGGHAPLVADSKLLNSSRDAALGTPGIHWVDHHASGAIGGRESRKMNTYQAVRDAMR